MQKYKFIHNFQIFDIAYDIIIFAWGICARGLGTLAYKTQISVAIFPNKFVNRKLKSCVYIV